MGSAPIPWVLVADPQAGLAPGQRFSAPMCPEDPGPPWTMQATTKSVRADGEGHGGGVNPLLDSYTQVSGVVMLGKAKTISCLIVHGILHSNCALVLVHGTGDCWCIPGKGKENGAHE